MIFGHAKDGNIHFMLTEQLGGGGPLDRFLGFTEDMVDLVLGQGGSLKAEHGTGRMMAPYVRRQYGDELYEVMREIKRLCDPRGLLNPGVLISDDPDAHINHLKVAPTVEKEVDRCVECGYCEPVCPSRDITTTPRQRIVLRREMQRAEAGGDAALVAQLREEYEYDAIDTCAVDGMCQTACPVSINTGDLMKRLRADNAGKIAKKGWATAAKHWAGTTRAASVALSVTAKLPDALVTGPNKLGRKVIDPDTLPLWSPELPAGGAPRRRDDATGHPGSIDTAGAQENRWVRRRSISPPASAPCSARARPAPGCRNPSPRSAPSRDHPAPSGRPAGPVLRNTLALQGNDGGLCGDGRPGAARAVGGQPAGRATRRL